MLYKKCENDVIYKWSHFNGSYLLSRIRLNGKHFTVGVYVLSHRAESKSTSPWAYNLGKKAALARLRN